ncbi:MAG: DUF4920 domain-containing protein [Bacteroidota bacterium]|nr:DUF4920 domain-containing protein [Bacteroidota bacterium]
MKNLLMFLSVLFIFSCSKTKDKKNSGIELFGNELSNEPVKSFKEVKQLLAINPETKVKVSGIITEFEKGKGFWLASFKKGVDPIFVSLVEKSMDLPDNIKGKTATVEGSAVKVVTTEIKHLVKAGYSFNVQVWCPVGKEVKNAENACIKVEECCYPSYGSGIAFKKDDLGSPLLHTKIVASGIVLTGY